MFINFNVDYCPGLKKSKFDMTLIGHSHFKFKKRVKKKEGERKDREA
jgi:hypothetical protein